MLESTIGKIRLRWFGHIQCMEDVRITNQAFQWVFETHAFLSRHIHESQTLKMVRALRIIYSYTNDMPYINALYCAAIPSLADCREQLSRKFFKSVQELLSCLSSLLPNPRDPSITTRLRFANKFPRLPRRTKQYQTFISYISYTLSHYVM